MQTKIDMKQFTSIKLCQSYVNEFIRNNDVSKIDIKLVELDTGLLVYLSVLEYKRRYKQKEVKKNYN